MSTAELQNQVIRKIESVKNDSLLKEVLIFIAIEMDEETIVTVSNAQKNAIDEARQQIKDGKYSTNEEFDKEIDGWLNA
jgi:GTPase Era involved in 16S rRNA processing